MRARKRVITALERPGTWPPPRREARAPAAGPGSRAPTAAPAGRAPSVSRPSRAHVPEPDVEPDLSVDLGRGLVLRNPLVVASGALGYGLELDDLVEPERLGAVCTRGTTLRPKSGNPPGRMARTPGGLLNAVGLHNPGLEAVLDRYAAGWARWRVPVVLNVAAGSAAGFADLAGRLEGVSGVAGIELNLACPNPARGGILFALEADAAAAVTAAVRAATDLPVLVKLSAAAPDPRAIARAVADAGADAISAINTLPGFAVDASRTGPELGATWGGLSGPAIRPVALRVVHELAAVVRIPIVGMGGVTSLSDVLDFLAAGATAVGIATAAIGDPLLPGRLAGELTDECRRRGLATYRPLIGTALPRRTVPPSSRGAEYRP